MACGRGVRVVGVLAAAATVWAALAVAAAPAAAQVGGFGDVAEGTYYSAPVAALAEQGVFVGTECAEGFCPEDPIDRKTMAIWVVRVLDGADPPAVTESRFDDVDAHSLHAPFIERLAELGVTGGCGDGRGFCPDQTVSRAQMAVFLTRAYGLPAGTDPGFVDVAGDAWYAAAVSSLAASGVTGGCGDGTGFCPQDDTSRAQMATFLHRAENMAPTEKAVRVLYVVPADREFRSDYSQAIRRATEHVRWWYQQQLDGLTFSLASPVPEKCRMEQPHDFYARYSWERVFDGVQHCAPVQGYTSETVWVIYPDVKTECSPTGSAGDGRDGYGELGRGGPGLTMLGADDLEGLAEPGNYLYCGEGPYPGSLGRWIGSLAHELGHALGLVHPPGCDDGLASCDYESLMHLGYVTYPATYLRDDEKAILRSSPFIKLHDPLLQPPAIPCLSAADDDSKSKIRGTLVGPGGQPLADILIWAWSGDEENSGYVETCHDGTFSIPVLDGTFACRRP
ncbi:MAG: hypothetical protein F4Z28_14955 [Gammaproteobacteria bacterium]|nr:hypothetical protein [Gammaproteobacteria bacterium]